MALTCLLRSLLLPLLEEGRARPADYFTPPTSWCQVARVATRLQAGCKCLFFFLIYGPQINLWDFGPSEDLFLRFIAAEHCTLNTQPLLTLTSKNTLLFFYTLTLPSHTQLFRFTLTPFLLCPSCTTLLTHNLHTHFMTLIEHTLEHSSTSSHTLTHSARSRLSLHNLLTQSRHYAFQTLLLLHTPYPL